MVLYAILEKREVYTMSLISIIVPIYNAEKYLARCVGSLKTQSLIDIEIILVNDCSTDGSLELARSFAQSDGRVRIIDLAVNGGVANARNKGLEVARGEYIAFVDNDDWVEPDRYERMYRLASAHGYDAVLDGFVSDDGNGKILYSRPMTSRMCVLSGAQMIQKMFFGEGNALTPWHGIYRHSIISGAFTFQRVRAEDAMFNFEFYARAKKVCLIPGCSYHFRELPVSQSRGYLPPESIYSFRGVEACAAYLTNNTALRSLVADFDFLADRHLLGEYAMVARSVCEPDCPESFEQRRNFLQKIADSAYFRQAFEDDVARSRLGGRKRRFLSLLYKRRVGLVTCYMFAKSKWQMIERLLKR